MKHEPKLLWRVLLLRNKGLALDRISKEVGLRDNEAVRNAFAEALKRFSPDHISQLMANNRVNMPDDYV